MNKSKIEWTDYTWNPITGCTFGCTYCYARKIAERFNGTKAWPVGFKPYLHEDRMNEPGNLNKPSKIFVCSMGEFFATGHEDWTHMLLHNMSLYYQHTFQLLTKQPENLLKWSPFPANCWVGVSAIGDLGMTQAVYYLDRIEATTKYISFEPLLESPSSNGYRNLASWLSHVNWVIIGQQTPVRKSTMPKIEWISEIVEAADKAGVSVFLKDNLKPLLIPSKVMDNRYWADHRDENGFEALHLDLRQEFPKEKVKAVCEPSPTS